MTLPAIALVLLAASGSANVHSVRYHRDERGAAFVAELAIADFTPGYDRLVAVSKDERTFLLYATFEDGRGRRASIEDLEAHLAHAATELAEVEAEIVELGKALKAAKATGAKELKLKVRGRQRTLRLAEAVTLRDDLDAARIDAVQSLASREKKLAAARRAEVEGPLAHVYGRFKEAGEAKVEVFRGPARGPGPLRTALTLSLALPSAAVSDPEVLSGWADAQARSLALGALRSPGGAALQRYAAMRSEELYGGKKGASDFPRAPRGREVDLYSVMSGLAAVQEALQLDSLGRAVETQEGPPVKLASLEGPHLASHDYDELRKGVEPKVFEAAAAAPADAFALHFTSANAAFELIDLLEAWGTDLAHAFEGTARDRGTQDRLFTQLALPRGELTRLYASRAIEAVTLVGHDPFVREGTDLTLVLTAKDLSLVRRAAQAARELARSSRKDASESRERYQGVELVTLRTADRALSTTYAEAGKFAFVGNSAAGVKAALDALAGRRPALVGSPDFRYLRTLFAGGEDAFAFLSDAFVRGVVGPRWKIGARRRLACAAQLQMIEYGRVLARRDRVDAPTLEDLEARGFVPKGLRCTHGGRYRLDPQGASCSAHGHLSFLTPLIELPFDEATATEAAEYRSFVEDYRQYWRQYIDPVGVRVKLGPPVEVETVILPLVDNTVYGALRELYSGAPAGLARQGESGKTVAAVSTTLSPSPRVQEAIRELMRDARVVGPDPWRWLGDQASLVIYDGDPLFTVSGGASGALRGARLDPVSAALATAALSSLTLPTALVVKVKDPQAARAAFERFAEAVELNAAERSRGEVQVAGYRLADLSGDDRVSVMSIALMGFNLRLYYAVIGDQLYVATRRWLVDEMLARGSVLPKENVRSEPGHLRVRIEHGKLKSALTAVQAGWGESMRDACFRNLADLAMVAEATRSSDLVGSVKQTLAYAPYCPAGGKYALERPGEAACSVHGTPIAPRQPRELADSTSTAQWLGRLEEIDLSLIFTPEGLRTQVRLTPKR